MQYKVLKKLKFPPRRQRFLVCFILIYSFLLFFGNGVSDR